MPEINYGSVPGGYNLTTSGSPAAAAGSPDGHVPGNDGMIQFFQEMARRRAAAEEAAMREQASQYQLAAMSQRDRAQAAEAGRPEMGFNKQTPFQTPWYSAQGAATRPVGLGPQMIPGMAADPHLLPPSMRPDQANVSYSPSVIGTARNNEMDEAAFDDQLSADRERSRQYGGEVGIGMTDPYRRIAQQAQNQGYGRF